MWSSLSPLLEGLLKVGALALILNEIRGIVLAVPVLYGIYQSGGTWMAIWLGLSSLGGIILSLVVPVFAARKLRKHVMRRAEACAEAA
jgi:hypothetical protein